VNEVTRLKVGDWLVDPALNQISSGSVVEHVEPKAIEVLLALCRRPGDVISRDQLLSEVWKGVTVSDDALTQSITKLRQALGDTSKEPSYIQTVSKRGYRLIAPVAPDHAGNVPTHDKIVKQSASFRSLRLGPLMAVALITAAALTGYWMLSQGERSLSSLAQLPDLTINPAETDNVAEILIQPFNEIEGDQLQRLLARGFTARLITELSRFPGIRVVSPKLTRSAEDEPVKKASDRNYVVSGEVQRGDENIRVYVGLTAAASGRTLWSEQYDRPYTDIFSLQDDLVRQIIGALRLKVSEAELQRSARPYTRNLDAYENFLRAQSALIIRSKADNELARQLYSRAIELDPNFARAYAGLALTYAADRRNYWNVDGTAALAKATELARTAQQIDPDIPETHFSLAYVNMERGELSKAVDNLRTALKLSPSFADAYSLLAAIQTYRGRPAETIPLMRTAMRLVPDAGHLYFLILGRAHFFLGDPSTAVLHLRKGISRNPESLELRLFLAAALASAGHKDEAAWEAEEIRTFEPTFSLRQWLRNYPMSDTKQIKQLVDAIEPLGL